MHCPNITAAQPDIRVTPNDLCVFVCHRLREFQVTDKMLSETALAEPVAADGMI